MLERDLDAAIERVAGQGGVLYAQGTASSGVSLFVADDRLVFDYNFFGEHSVVESEREVPVGRSVVGVRFRRSGRSGTATLTIDGEPCGVLELPVIMRIISSLGSSVGQDHGSQVSPRYSGPNPFGGRLERLDVQLVSERQADTAAAEAREIMSRQ